MGPEPHGIHLRRSDERPPAQLVAAATGGERVGLDGVLADLDHEGQAVRVPAPAATWGFRWDDRDRRTDRWWPQGISTSADHHPSGEYDARRIVLTSWYAKDRNGRHQGSRISVVDLTDASRPRYRHVLLVDAGIDDDGSVALRPLRVHAGGIVWHGEHLHVAATALGIHVCRPADILRVDDHAGGRYVLPVRFSYEAFADHGRERMRYSFLSLDRTAPRPRMVAGEYGRGAMTTRLVDFAVDPTSLLLDLADDGAARPASFSAQGVPQMQGAVVVDGRWYVSASSGRFLRGSMHVGRPGAFTRRARVLPAGVEDLSYWPDRDELWTLSEYPGRRFVLAMDRARLR